MKQTKGNKMKTLFFKIKKQILKRRNKIESKKKRKNSYSNEKKHT